MNEYEIRVNNVVIRTKGMGEYSTLMNTGLFKNIGDIVDFVKTTDVPDSKNNAWIYQVELNGMITLAYIKRV